VIRAGIIGFGMGGRVFHGPLLFSVEGLELAAVAERNTNKAAERYPNIKTYRSISELLSDDSIGLVVVTTPSGTHRQAPLHSISRHRETDATRDSQAKAAHTFSQSALGRRLSDDS
jgi:hypothetical protein